MEYHKIDQLLGLYWQGETTVEQEQELHGYFSQGNVHPDFQAYQPLFLFYKKEGDQHMKRPIGQAQIRRLPVIQRAWQVVAVGLLCFGLFFGIWRTQTNAISDIEYQEAMAALAFSGAAIE